MNYYDHPEWDWAAYPPYCKKHRGQHLPCAACVGSACPSLVRLHADEPVTPAASAEDSSVDPYTHQVDESVIEFLNEMLGGCL